MVLTFLYQYVIILAVLLCTLLRRRSFLMATCQSQQLDDLLAQQKYTPAPAKLKQLDACETLAQLIDPDKTYPYDFVCYKLTGYQPKQRGQDQSIIGKMLLSDLAIYALTISKSLDLTKAHFLEQLYTVDTLTQHMRVSTKTVDRWRRKGLIGRYVVLDGPRKTVCFTAETVKAFITKHQQKISQGQKYVHLSQDNIARIIKAIHRWSNRFPNLRQQAIARIAKNEKRNIETINKIVLQHEKETHQQLFCPRHKDISVSIQKEIIAHHLDGKNYKVIASLLDVDTSVIKWILKNTISRKLKHQRISFIHDDAFTVDRNHKQILNAPQQSFPHAILEIINGSNNPNASHNTYQTVIKQIKETDTATPSRSILNNYILDICNHDILTADQEYFLFRKYNFLKYLANDQQQCLDIKKPQSNAIQQLQDTLAMIKAIKNILIQHNLRLVLSVARRHTQNDHEILEMISEGNIILINAIDTFNFTRDVKFSTYGTYAIVKQFASFKSRANQHAFRNKQSDSIIEAIEALTKADDTQNDLSNAKHTLYNALNTQLETREKVVLCKYFGLEEHDKQTSSNLPAKPMSFKQIGDQIGLSKERVRQVYTIALEKLRRVIPMDAI